MGNNFVCANYYCQEVSFKPEWFSELTWTIEYDYINNNTKPYKIEKGILTINDTKPFNLLLSKKLLINFNEIRNISIPINFRYIINDEINISIIFSNKLIFLKDIINLDISCNDLFYINLKLLRNKIIIFRSFNNNIIKKKIKSKKINSFKINLENNFNILLITEQLLNTKYEEKYIKPFNLDENNEYYLSILVNSKQPISDKEFIMLHFD